MENCWKLGKYIFINQRKNKKMFDLKQNYTIFAPFNKTDEPNGI